MKIVWKLYIAEQHVNFSIGKIICLHATRNKKRYLYTFDIIPWNNIQNTVLNDTDFKNNQIIQIIDDLSIYEVVEKHSSIFKEVDFVFSASKLAFKNLAKSKTYS